MRVHVRTAFIIDTVQDDEQQYEKLSSHVQDVLHMLIALSRRVLHKESRLASVRTGREQVLCLLSASGVTINKSTYTGPYILTKYFILKILLN